MSAALIMKGFLLGWSVAWPPGPVNAEMVRRALARGFWPAYAVGLGASSGDFLWALFVAGGAGSLATLPPVRRALMGLSLVLLLLLAYTFLRGAWASYRSYRRGDTHMEGMAPPRPLDSARGGFWLGLTMALSSPWNVAFWLAVIGSQAAERTGFAAAMLLAASVIVGAASWGVVLSGAVRLGARFATPMWEIATRALTGALMLFFAARLVWLGALGF